METANLLSGVLLGSLGIGYFIYGKRQGRLLALCCGLLLCGMPYLIDSLGLLWLVSVPLLLLPWFIEI